MKGNHHWRVPNFFGLLCGRGIDQVIKAVVFDFGNVIYRFDNRVVLKRIAEDTGRSLQELEGILYRSSEVILQYEKGEVGSEEFFARIKAMAGVRMSRDKFIRAYTEKFTPIPETIRVIQSLSGKFKLGLLSNTSEWDFEYEIKRTEVFPLFDVVTTSFQVHALKPAREIYQDVLTKLRVTAGECVYVDDIEDYVLAARKLGMHALQYRGGNLSESLRNLFFNVDGTILPH